MIINPDRISSSLRIARLQRLNKSGETSYLCFTPLFDFCVPINCFSIRMQPVCSHHKFSIILTFFQIYLVFPEVQIYPCAVLAYLISVFDILIHIQSQISNSGTSETCVTTSATRKWQYQYLRFGRVKLAVTSLLYLLEEEIPWGKAKFILN